MLTFSKDKKVVDVLRRDIEKTETGTLFFNNAIKNIFGEGTAS